MQTYFDKPNIFCCTLFLGENPISGTSQGHIPWTMDKLQAFFTYCRQRDPMLTKEASQVLGTYYKVQRKCDDQSMARTTVRMLQSLIRFVVDVL